MSAPALGDATPPTITPPTTPTAPSIPTPRPALSTPATLLAFTALSIAWSWPWAAYDGHAFPTRQFDLYGVLWVVEHARDLLVDLRSTTSGLPAGEDVTRLDTWVLAGIGALLHGLDPVRIVQALVLLGPVASAFAAERCAARGLGVARPWSLVAGVVYAFSGLGATALLEGHVYYLLAPWLPLQAWAMLAATGPGARVRHGALAALFWALSLLTSAYLGLAATLLAVVLAARGLATRLDRRPLLRSAAGFVAVALPVGVAYTAVFARGTGAVASDPATVLAGGSATLATLATWSPDIDLANHSIAAPLGFAALALVLVAPVVLRDRAGWRALTALAAVAILLALGPAVQVGMGGIGTWYQVDLRGAGAVFGLLHFPVRMLWLWYLCAGLVAALSAEALARRAGRPAAAVLALVAADAFVTTGVPVRTGAVLAAAPSAYARAPAGRPVLDLFAEDPHPGSGLDLWARRLACYYQLRHGLPVPGRCLGPHGAPPQEAAERALRAALLDGDDPRPALATLDVGAVAVHLDLFRPEERRRVLTGLSDALGAPVVTTDGGETVALFPVAPPGP